MKKDGSPPSKTLSRRIRAGFNVGGILTLILALATIFLTVVVAIGAGQTGRQTVPFTRATQEINYQLLLSQLDVTRFVLGRQDNLRNAKTAVSEAEEAVERAKSLRVSEKGLRQLSEIAGLLTGYRDALRRLESKDTPEGRNSEYQAIEELHARISNRTIELTEEFWGSLQGEVDFAVAFVTWVRVFYLALFVVFVVVAVRVGQTIRRSLGGITRQVNNSVEEIRKRASDTAVSADEMAASAEQVTRAMEEVASSVEQVTVGSGHSAAASQDIASLIGQIHESVQGVADGAGRTLKSIEEFYKEVTEAGIAADQGTAVADAANQAMSAALSAEEGFSINLRRLTDEITRVSQILGAIKNISSQTELLALNASIEAARAQEHGRGFSVVADEIKKLSVQTASSTEEISDIVEHINAVNEQVIADMSRNLASTQSIVEQAGSLRRTFGGIARGVRNLVTLMDGIMQEAKSQWEDASTSSGLSQKVLMSTEEIAAQVEQVSAAMQELSSTVQEVLAASEEMRSTARSQAQTSSELFSLSDSVAAEMKRIV